MRSFAVLDFETEGIELRPAYPPKPVGVSIKLPGKAPRYYGWGHPAENNCTRDDGVAALKELWASGLPVVMHNAKFDLDVAETCLGLPPLPWERVHDTMIMLFLMRPHAKSMSLKPSAEELLNMPPEEQDKVKDWVLANVPEAKQKPSSWGAYICRAPGKLVGTYANGDVVRTAKLFTLCYKYLVEHDMLEAYFRERRLLPILLRSERKGLRVDIEGIKRDLPEFQKALVRTDNWIAKYLMAPGINLDSSDELANALEKKGFAGFLSTPTGKRSTGKESMNAVIGHDKKLNSALGYRNRMMTCTNMFMSSWLEKGESTGRVYPSWHQTRNARSEKDSNGARTGRIICTDPNLLNLSKDFESKNDGYVHPKFLKVPILPLVRKYMLPEAGEVWCHRDFSSQELRILAHYEDDLLLNSYQKNLNLDVHDFVRQEVERIAGVPMTRSQAKTINFAIIYGSGLGAIAEGLKVDVDTAKRLRDAQRKAIPGLGILEKSLKQLAKTNQPLRTWGGREYYVEEPKVINGRLVTFGYKLLNYLCQGSAADITKEAIIRWGEVRGDSTFLNSVYDEINLSSPIGSVKKNMKTLNAAMASIEVDVKMLSDGKTGPNWGTLTKYEDN